MTYYLLGTYYYFIYIGNLILLLENNIKYDQLFNADEIICR